MSKQKATPPDPGSVLESMRSLSGGEVSGLLAVVLPTGQPAELTQLRPTTQILPALLGVVHSAVTGYCECETISYEPAESPADGQVMWLSSSEVPLLLQIVTDADDFAALPLFEPNQANLANLKLAAMRVDGADHSAIFVQFLRGNQVVARSTKFGGVLRRGVLDAPDGEVVIFPNQVTAIVTELYTFFRNRSAFQQLFGLLDELRSRAKDTLLDITSKLRIEGLDAFLAAVQGTPAMLGKMASIQRKLDSIPQYRDALTMPKLIKFIEAHPKCEVEITGSGRNAHFVFHNDPRHRYKILKLLDDDYLRSELTTLEYESNSKSAPLG